MKAIVVVILMFTGITGSAQSLLTPSQNSIEKKWMKQTQYEMTWYAFRDTARMEIGKVDTQVMVDEKNLTVITRVILKNTDSPWIDSTVANAVTLKPVRHSSYNKQRDMVLDFGEIVTGFYRDKTKNTLTSIHDTVTGGYFDSNLYPVLIGWLPVTVGYTCDISIYDYNPNGKTGVLKASVKKVTSGRYQTDKSGTRDVWIITVTDEIGSGGNAVSRYYFDKADRRLWNQEVEVSGRKMMMKRVE